VNNTITEAQAVEQFNQLLSDSVNKRLRSDVAIGTSLSGGLDSSAIVAYCAQQKSAHYTHKCFTAIFPGFEQNEEAFAKKVAEQYGLQHYLVNINTDTLIGDMERLLYYQEEPATSASVLAQYKVYEAAGQQGVTVVLDGQGADEVLAGYSKYYKWYWQELYRQKSLAKSGEMQAARALGTNEPFGTKNKAAALFPEFAASMLQSKKAKTAYRHPYFNEDFAFANKRNSYYTTPTHFTLNGVLYFNTVVYGLEELLRYADRNSSAHAVEVRLPFLSHHLVEFLFSLPPHFKIKNGWTKWLLRKAAEPLLPQDIVWRKDKVGFEPPQKLWMQQKSVQEAIYEGKKILVQNGILKPSILHKKIQPQSAYAADNFDWRYWTASFLFKAL
jgi:asparagine synthase (glutamine-hydrolysing)